MPNQNKPQTDDAADRSALIKSLNHNVSFLKCATATDSGLEAKGMKKVMVCMKDAANALEQQQAEIARLTGSRNGWEDDAKLYCQNAEHANAKLAELQAVVDRLDKTRDGVPVIYTGDVHDEPLWWCDCGTLKITFAAGTSGPLVSDCWSTREAAEQAKETTDEH